MESKDPLSVVYSFPHRIGAPGIGWTAWNQVTELVAAGHEVHLVAAGMARPIPGLASRRLTLQLGSRRIPHRAIGRDRAFDWHDRVAASVVRRVVPEVVHAWPLAARRTFEAVEESGGVSLREAPNTHTAHAYEVVAAECARIGVTMPATASHTFNARHLATEQREWDLATAVLAPSDAVAESFVRRGHDPARIVRHRYGYRAGPDAEPATARDGAEPLTALFLGRGEPRKGLHHALAAWLSSRASAGGRFLIHGELDPGYAAYLAEPLAHPSVRLLGFTDDPAGALAAADVLLLPTIEEGSALVTYEAQAAGCVPLVSTAAGAFATHEVHALLHEPGDAETLARQLDRLAERPSELARLSAAGVAHAPELSWTAAGVALVAAYRETIARSQQAEEAAHALAE